MAIRVRKGTRDDPSKEGYVTYSGDGPEDFQRMKGGELHKQIKRQGRENIEKQAEDQRQGEDVRYANGTKLRLPTRAAEDAIRYMRRRLPKGPPATRFTMNLGARIVTMPDGSKRIVRDDDEEEVA